jgi:hypothetical protein
VVAQALSDGHVQQGPDHNWYAQGNCFFCHVSSTTPVPPATTPPLASTVISHLFDKTNPLF